MAKDTLKNAFSISVLDVADQLNTDAETGLDQTEAKKRIDRFGPNRLRSKKKKSALSILMHQFQSIIVWLLFGAAALSFFLGDIAEGLAIVFVLILNSAIGFFTEYKAARSMEALMSIAEVKTRVRRGRGADD